MGSIAVRVALRASMKVGKDFSSPEALEEYLKEHPDADRTKHKVNKNAPKGPQADPGKKPTAPGKPPPIPDAAKKKKPPPIPEAAKKKKAPEEHSEDDHGETGRFEGWKKNLKGLKDSAAKFVEKSPKAVKIFLSDPDFRKSALKEAKTAVTQLPKKAVHRLVETAKEEVHEFKTAAEGVKAVMSGKKMSKHQKHAFRTVATHLAIGAAAAAFAATGPLAGAGVFSKNMATHVALKSVKRALGSIHTLNELQHIGHGVLHLLGHIASEGESKVDPEEAMTNLVLAAVAKQIEQLTDDDFTDVLNNMEDEGDKTAALVVLRRFVARPPA